MKKNLQIIVILSLASSMVACGNPSEVKHPEWSCNSVIYELNIRQYTPEGTLAAAEAHLPRLKEAGVDLIWLMPIQPIGVEARKGTLGSYYSIKDYYEVNPEFGTTDDVRRFIDTAHSLGQKVILDWVANHTSRDAAWLAEHRDWYQLDSLGNAAIPHGWDDTAALDYNNPQMRKAMIKAMRYWTEEIGFDGLRCDVAWNVPTDFWDEATAKMRRHKKELFFLAEAEMPEHHAHAFDMSYAWKFHHLINKIAKGEKTVDDLRAYFIEEAREFPADGYRMLFTSNHDENSWAGTEKERMGDADRTFAALTYFLPGMPLIYSGQEVGFDRRLEFFEKDSIDWIDRGSYTEFYTKLNSLRHSSPALASGQCGGELTELVNDTPQKVFSAVRSAGGQTIAAVFNLSNENIQTTVDFGELTGNYLDYMNDFESGISAASTFTLLPWQYIILIKE